MTVILPSFSIVPRTGDPKASILIVSMSTWVDGKCTGTTQLFSRVVESPAPVGWAAEFLPYAMEWADVLYQEISAQMSAKYQASIRETNARPSDTSVPS